MSISVFQRTVDGLDGILTRLKRRDLFMREGYFSEDKFEASEIAPYKVDICKIISNICFFCLLKVILWDFKHLHERSNQAFLVLDGIHMHIKQKIDNRNSKVNLLLSIAATLFLPLTFITGMIPDISERNTLY